MSKQIIWNSKMVQEASDKLNNGFVLKKLENPFFDNVPGMRRAGLAFRMTQDEIDEYIKCKMDVHYFAEKYCWVKGEKGEPVKLKLRDYQKEILDNFFNNRFNILMASRQIGKCFSFNTYIKIIEDGIEYDIRFGKLYYSIVSNYRNLTLLEKIKIKIYDIIHLLETTYQYERKP
jgi:hypothetical protein